MKKLLVVLTMLSILIGPAFDAEARKKFGSRSKGKTKSTLVQKKQAEPTKSAATPNNTAPNKLAPAKKSSSKKGIMAGVLGGLLAGGLIAAMMGDDFEGFQFLEMLLIAGVVFLLFKVIRSAMAKKASPAMASPQMSTPQGQFREMPSQSPQAPQGMGGFAQAEVPMNLPPGFDLNGFLQGARDHYHTVQKAWNDNDEKTLAEYLDPSLLQEFMAERANIDAVSTEVMFIDSRCVRADASPSVWEISVEFTGKYRDQGDGVEEPIREIWHLERDPSAEQNPWRIVGVEDLIS